LPQVGFSWMNLRTRASTSALRGRPAASIGFGVDPFLGDEDAEPTEQGVRSDDCGDLAESAAANDLGLASESNSLRISEALGRTAQLFAQDAVLLLEEFDHCLLLPVYPATKSDQQKL